MVFRRSRIAGPRQFGTEDQGWFADFLSSVLEGQPITIYGDCFQVRDVLHVDDLIDAMQAASRSTSRTAGEMYNLGGGLERAISVVEMLKSHPRGDRKRAHPSLQRSPPGDQPLYISNTSKLSKHTAWHAHRSCRQTIEDFLVIPTAPSYLFWRCPQPELRVPRQWISALDRASKKVVIGPHGSVTPLATLHKTGADIVLRGEPDQPLPQLPASAPQT